MDGVYDVLGVCLFDFPMGLVVLTSFPLNQRTNLPRDHKQTTLLREHVTRDMTCARQSTVFSLVYTLSCIDDPL